MKLAAPSLVMGSIDMEITFAVDQAPPDSYRLVYSDGDAAEQTWPIDQSVTDFHASTAR